MGRTAPLEIGQYQSGDAEQVPEAYQTGIGAFPGSCWNGLTKFGVGRFDKILVRVLCNKKRLTRGWLVAHSLTGLARLGST